MPTVQEILKTSGLIDEVIAGLPKEAVAAFGGILTDAETKVQTAAQQASEAAELRRQAELDRKDIQKYVDDYSLSLNKQGSLQAKYDAVVAYVDSLKAQGFDVKLPVDVAPSSEKKPVVPGSPAIGGNAVDEGKILGRVGNVMSQWLDANNEHIRLYGVPVPDPSTNIAEEAARARKPVGEYMAEKYKFRERQAAKEREAYDARVAADVKAKVDEQLRVEAEKRGSNPNLRAGESSRASHVPKLKTEEFHKGDGFQPKRQRESRMLENLHKDLEAIHSAA
jgi:hypothetical protein